uniref:Pyrin domain-containing protein n=1 Tax=Oreochromis aureus TaxID=47969 RepID=A0AAZ1WXF3_OREAU
MECPAHSPDKNPIELVELDRRVKMTTPKQILLETLEHLGHDDFEKFKWHLKNNGSLEGLPAIPESKLENAERMDIVDLMFHTYCINTFEVTKNLLGSINRNDLLENLNNIIPEPKGKSGND